MNLSVVVNAQGQHSILPVGRLPLPAGWEHAGFEGTEQECLDHIAKIWGTSYVRLPSRSPGNVSAPSIPELVSAAALNRPDGIALRWQGTATTYRELEHAAEVLASRLAARGVQHGDVVPVRLPRSPGLVAALLAVLKLGAAYVAIPADWPPSRLSKLISTLRSPLALDHESKPTEWPCPTLLLPPDLATGDAPSTTGAWRAPGGEDPACVFFTSGSTGEPKGAVCPHRALTGLLHQADFAVYDAGTVTLQSAALPWDAFALELWGPLVNGGCCVLPPEEPLGPVELRGFIERDGVNTLFLTTSLFNTLVDVAPRSFAGLKQVMTGGERISVPHVRAFLAQHPGIPLIHAYGPVEATVFTTTHRIQDSDLAAGTLDIPIGRPVRGAEVQVLGVDGQPVGPGETGELQVLGNGLSLGYFADARETARRFVPISGRSGTCAYRTGDLVRVDADGILSHVGRVDRQVKLRGVRIEPGEVEAVMREHPGISETAVVPVKDPSGRVVALHGWFTGAETDAADLRAHVARQLPAAWVPTTFGRLDAFPRGQSGKTDTRILAAWVELPPAERPSTPHASADLRDTATRAVAEVLGRPPDDVNRGFVESGGTSLSAMTLAARLTRETGRCVTLADILAADTTDAIVRTLEEAPSADAESMPRRRSLPTRQESVISRLFNVEGELDAEALRWALHTTASVHPVLCPGETPAVDFAIAAAVRTVDELLPATATADVGGTVEDSVLRVRLAPVAERENAWALCVVTHRTHLDDWSLSILFHELSKAYQQRVQEPDSKRANTTAPDAVRNSEPDTRPPDVPYCSGIHWPARQSGEHHSVGSLELDIPASAKRYARSHGSTLAPLLLAVLSEALKGVATRHDINASVHFAGRDAPQLERVLGAFETSVPVRIEPHTSSFESFAARLAAAQSAMHAALSACAGSGRTAEHPPTCTHCGSAARTQVAVVRHLHPLPELPLHGCVVRALPATSRLQDHDLVLEVRPRQGGRLATAVHYRRAVVSDEVAAGIRNSLAEQLRLAGS